MWRRLGKVVSWVKNKDFLPRVRAESFQIRNFTFSSLIRIEGSATASFDSLRSTQTLEKAQYRDMSSIVGFMTDLHAKQNEEESAWQFLELDLTKTKAAAGDKAAQYFLGRKYFLSTDEAKAFPYFLSAADQGDAKSQLMEGLFYEEGAGGVKRDDQLALRYYLLAANQEVIEAQYRVGKIYLAGNGVDTDLTKAVASLTLAADRNHASAQYLLGERYRQGCGVPRDITKAVYLYKLAAAQQLPAAHIVLGLLHLTGTGVQKDQITAWKHLAAAAIASDGDGEGFFRAGCLCELGIDLADQPFPADQASAARFYQQAAGLGHAAAEASLARCYLEGSGVTQDREKGDAMLQKAAARRSASASVMFAGYGTDVSNHTHQPTTTKSYEDAVKILQAFEHNTQNDSYSPVVLTDVSSFQSAVTAAQRQRATCSVHMES